MRILFDQGTPAPLRRFLETHEVVTAAERGWGDLSNGNLIDAAEDAGFDVLVTTDRNLQYQQNLSGRKIAIAVILQSAWPVLEKRATEVGKSIVAMIPGDFIEI